jgi:uncharacterized protein with NRDE domain
MCTLAFAFQTDRRWPLVVAANRDERLGRAAESWALREPAAGPRYAAPKDLLAGGTWIGVSARGLFAAVTNFHAPSGAFPDPSRRSRGELVGKALSHPDAAAARTALSAEDAAAYNPFHLVVADAERAFLWRHDGERTALDDLAPGLHVVTEQAHEDRGPRGELVRARWPLGLEPAHLRELLTVHGAGREGTCIHADPLYGTRSSTVLRLASSLGASELYVADGRPCTSPLEDRSRLLAALALDTGSGVHH